MTADIAKMYRMVLVKPDERRFQRIFWREKLTDDLKCYELKTVTYGTASAPYLAIRCLHELALEHANSKPVASEAIRNNFYVDDFLYGADSRYELIQVQQDVSTILASAGLQLRKWLTNDQELYPRFKILVDEGNSVLKLGENETNKTLGICWDATSDNIKYSVKSVSNSSRNRITKRSILSEISQIFDPLGLLGPIIITSKLLIQRLWQAKISWDDNIPQTLENEWIKFRDNLQEIKEINIPRHVILPSCTRKELHGFGDASEKAYGACIYIRSITDNQISSHLLCAKSKVAPQKQITLPRLELCSALLLAQLVDKVRKTMKVQFDSEHLWSDSTIALSWIRAQPNRWKTFVANRVSEIQQLTEIQNWNHVSSQDNPADLISRGVSVQQLKTSILWQSGPSWLLQNNLPISDVKFETDENNIPEQRVVVTHIISNSDFNIFNRFSKLSKLQRVIAYCLRFIANCRLIKNTRTYSTLTVNEIKISTNLLVRLAQQEAFPSEYKSLSNNKEISSKSNLLSLRPWMDKDLIRVGGRLVNSKCSFSKKHPIILPRTHKLTTLIFNSEHEAYCLAVLPCC